MSSYAQAFIALWLYRYVRLIVNCIAHWTFKPIPLPEGPFLTPQDVTVIIPTLDGDGDELRETIRSTLAAEPYELILVTVDAHHKRLCRLIDGLPAPARAHIRTFSVSQANKRRQMCRAIPEVRTAITVFADDDVTWPASILHWTLAPFDNRPDIGGVGTCQRLRRTSHLNIWNFLGALYLERRNFEISATSHLDGGISCLSGRTVAYRTHILQDPAFTYGFTHEYWIRRYQLNADDDNFITRWMVSHGWKTYVQYCGQAELRTTLESNAKFLKQCLRWSRSNWRSNLTSMLVERHIWRQQPWSAYALHLATLSPPAFLGDGLLIFLCYKATSPTSISPSASGYSDEEVDTGWTYESQFAALSLLACWMCASKFLKLLGHFWRYPQDLPLLPVSILFGYLHGLIKVYALFTLDVTTWGSREGADLDDAYRMIRLSQREKSTQ